MLPERTINKIYTDPLDLIWIHAASELGMRVQRSGEVNASWDGQGVLTIGTAETLDPDDTLAQMVLHEVCHALCEGPACLSKPDWGLDNFDRAKRIHEHACLRLQAAFADEAGMRTFFASTTMFRDYYDALPAEPLLTGDDPAIEMAEAAWQRAHQSHQPGIQPWASVLRAALQRTALIAAALHGVTAADSLWHADSISRENP